MEYKFWIAHSLKLFTKAKEEGLLTNKVWMAEWWKWLISNKILFYCSFRDFKDAIKYKENLKEIKALLFTSFRLNLPDLKYWIKINKEHFALERFKVNSRLIINIKNCVHNNSSATLKARRRKFLQEEAKYLRLFELEPKIIEKELARLQIEFQEWCFNGGDVIYEVTEFANNNPYTTGEKEPFKILLDYYFNIDNLLHNDIYWKTFEEEYSKILVSYLKNREVDKMFASWIDNRISDVNVELFEELATAEESEEVVENLRQIEDNLLNKDDFEEIEKYNKLLSLAIENKEKANKQIRKWFK